LWESEAAKSGFVYPDRRDIEWLFDIKEAAAVYQQDMNLECHQENDSMKQPEQDALVKKSEEGEPDESTEQAEQETLVDMDEEREDDWIVLSDDETEVNVQL
jgi:thiol:disulfide interchange protein